MTACDARLWITIGDFNSHSTAWGYNESNQDGHLVESWAETNHLTLIHDFKHPATLNCRRWRRGYNPDLVFVCDRMAGSCARSILEPVPHSQHRPVQLSVVAAVTPKIVPFRRRFNYKKANWKSFANKLDDCVDSIPDDDYDCFAATVRQTARQTIPRGCRNPYIPGLNDDSKVLYERYQEIFEEDPFSDETIETGELLMETISKQRRESWKELIEHTDMTHNSKKAWSLLRKLGNDPTKGTTHPPVSANDVAHQLLLNGKGNPNHKERPIRKEPSQNDDNCGKYTPDFTLDELNTGIKLLVNGKATGLDDIGSELIKQFGPKTLIWLLGFLNRCLRTNHLPQVWLQAKVIAIPKPGKPPDLPASYRPISLLCHLYKLYERLILNRLSDIEELLIPQQAGFRPGKSCTSQVLNLTQYIEDGFQNKAGCITGTAFVDLSAAYDTVNHRRLLKKVQNISQDSHLTKTISSMLTNRRFFVNLAGKRSRWRVQRNGLPQGSVLAPFLFNIYTNDQPTPANTRSFIYADDLCIATQSRDFNEIEVTLCSALETMSSYYSMNHLRANPSKTQISAFHLRTKGGDAKRELNVTWEGEKLPHTHTPVYLGVTLDRILSFKHHIQKAKAKVCARNNILAKLANTQWGATTTTLRTTALALCYSAAEYACPVWERSCHAKKIDPTLNESCRRITGCLRPTPVDQLYCLAGIAPPAIRRDIASRVERYRQSYDPRHMLYGEARDSPSRLRSRHSFLADVTPLPPNAAETERKARWQEKEEHDLQQLRKQSLPPGYDEPRRTWLTLNRLRTGVGRTNVNLVKWGYADLATDTTCPVCGLIDGATTAHFTQCPVTVTSEDLMQYNQQAKDCVSAHTAHV